MIFGLSIVGSIMVLNCFKQAKLIVDSIKLQNIEWNLFGGLQHWIITVID